MSTSLGRDGAGLGSMGLSESKMKALCEQAGFHGFRQVLPE
jgi:hypothetical protein